MMAGRNSQVWQAIEQSSGRPFALKLLLPERVSDPEQRRALAHEARVGMSLRHPNIIHMIEFNPDKENPYIVMEFFPSTNLKLGVLHKKEVVRKYAREIIEQAAQALSYMHSRGWAHKDVKPDNILVNGVGQTKLIDFALAERLGGRLKRLIPRRRRLVQGTRSYMSPEQIRGEPLDPRADVYSLGCTVYELFTGRPPFRADSPKELLVKHLRETPRNPQSLNPALTPEMDRLIMRMLAKRKQDRPADMNEVLSELRRIKITEDERRGEGQGG